jgi:hypothetical protein
MIASGEVAASTALVALFKSIKLPSGIAGLVVGPVLAAVESYVESALAAEEAKFTPAVIVAYIVSELQAVAAKV